MHPCEATGRAMLRSQMLPCPYDAWWELAGHWFCYFHAKVASALLEASWRKLPKEIPRSVGREPADILAALMAEWDAGP